MDEIRAIVVGFGSTGRSHLQTLRLRPGVEVLAIVRQARKAETADAPIIQSLAKGLALGPTLALICTPHAHHYHQVQQCLDAGCHVFVEKPLALRYDECEKLVDLAARKCRLLVVGLQRRHEGFAQVFRIAQATGSLGKIELVHGFFAHRFTSDMALGWRGDRKLAGYGILDDSAMHLIDLLVLFAGGRVTWANGRLQSRPRSTVAHSFTASLVTDSGACISATGSYLSPADTVQEEISILGTAGSLFARRFCRVWNTDPPSVFYKSADGKVARDHDMNDHPRGRELPLLALLDVLQGRLSRDDLFTEGAHVLETHRAVDLIRGSTRHNSCG